MITLIGKEIAKKDSSFIFQGPAEECENCRIKSACVGSLEIGRKYTITDVKDTSCACRSYFSRASVCRCAGNDRGS